MCVQNSVATISISTGHGYEVCFADYSRQIKFTLHRLQLVTFKCLKVQFILPDVYEGSLSGAKQITALLLYSL